MLYTTTKKKKKKKKKKVDTVQTSSAFRICINADDRITFLDTENWARHIRNFARMGIQREI